MLAIGYFMTGMSLLKHDLIFIAWGLSLSVTACLKLTQPVAFEVLSAKDPRLDGAFTLFYMSINIGSLIALSLAPVMAG
ncbi:hypothetical protein ACLB1T_09790 [Escherichia coli]